MLDKNERISELLDWYCDLLTDKQQDIMLSYYHENLSLAEIAENNDISRSAVHDSIKRSGSILEQYEEKLHLLDKYKRRSAVYKELEKYEEDSIIEILNQLRKIEE